MPHLIHVAPGSEQLCARYEFEARSSYFDGYYTADTVPAGTEKMPEIKSQPLNTVPGFEEADEFAVAYTGDFDGDGDTENIYALRSGGNNSVNYRYYFRLFKLTSERRTQYQNLQLSPEELKHPNPEWVRRNNYDRILNSEPKSVPHNHPSEGRAATAATEAYRLLDTMKVREHEGRLYVDVLVTDFGESDRILLAYDSDMRPRATCIIAVKGDAKELAGNPYNLSAMNFLQQATRHITGIRDACGGGSSKPFYYLKWRKRQAFHDSFFKPWEIINNPLGIVGWNTENFSKEVRAGTGHWNFEPFQFLWSMEDSFNRRAYRMLGKHSLKAIDELALYYLKNYNVNEQVAHKWAGYHVFRLRSISAPQGSFLYTYRDYLESIDRMNERTANADDFIQLAHKIHLNYWMFYHEKEEISQFSYDKALNMAVGASAPNEILTEIITRGADVNSPWEAPLLNVVDHPEILNFMIDSGANPDQRNGFGKTALMTAAHMNQRKAVKILLIAGADPNAKTWLEIPEREDNPFAEPRRNVADCRYETVKYRERTALMYAAENASLELFKILIEAGADNIAKDSRGRSIGDYLKMNEVMSTEEKEEALHLLRSQQKNNPE
ncbi:ankyrin repeat domain-containing protein [Emcibacter sp.]|uniref:ankyrin repeat domain-containing protein n=1 Tax=Emcibacter sp. TaxID=1979954 RepID=UPI002AA5FB9E|nr:ankyrin repeat domain-containing protein [Emcibacter sp.]